MSKHRPWAGTPLAAGLAAVEAGAAWRRTGVAGLQYHGYGQPGLDGLPQIPEAGDRVQLVREPGNPHDPNAILVEWKNSVVLGHVPRGFARLLAPELDAGRHVQAYVADPGRGRAWDVGLLLVGPACVGLWQGRLPPDRLEIPPPPAPSDEDDDEIPF